MTRVCRSPAAGWRTLPETLRVHPFGTLGAVVFLQPEQPGRVGREPGSVDYRFARRRLLHRYRSGELTREDVCDAQAELLRVGANCSRKATAPCPVCGESTLRVVQFAFGPRLPPGGRVVEGRAALQKLAQRYGDREGARTYAVEVCLTCRWNHLLEILPLSSAGASRRR